ncbi:MAG TPA: hypothetical protein VD886_23005 [Herpetosiphonaceae bacterium]|nr:hypothetical protein [Herpetosiphonaceae bacterium]
MNATPQFGLPDAVGQAPNRAAASREHPWQPSAGTQQRAPQPDRTAAGIDQPWAALRRVTPLGLVQPARLGALPGGADPARSGRAGPFDHPRPGQAAAGLDQPWPGTGSESAPALGLVQPARLATLPGGAAGSGVIGHLAQVQRTARLDALRADRGELAWMAPLESKPAPGVAAQALAGGWLQRFSADGASSPEPAALELLRPAGAEHDHGRDQPGAVSSAQPGQAAPSLDLLQPMREAQAAPIQRAQIENDGASADSADAAARPEADIEALARQVYARLRRRLKIDAERLGH